MKQIKYIGILIFVLAGTGQVWSQKIDVKGDWEVESSCNDIQAGEDISSEATSDYDELEIYVNGNVNKSTWKIQVKKDDICWNSALEVWVRRTGSGNGSGECWDGTSWQKVAYTNMDFFGGKRVMNKIPVQVQIRGMSVTIPAREYTTNLVFTLYEY